jgi:hypothetical protein
MRLVVWIAIAFLAGCTFAPVRHVAELRRGGAEPKILVMPLDVELTEMGIGGALEPKTEWTREARELIALELRARQPRLGYQFVDYESAFEGSPAEEALVDQLVKVQGLVGRSIMRHRNPTQGLPSLGANPKYSLGTDVRILRDRTGADYALFIHVRDAYASDGRKAAMVAGVFLRLGMIGGNQFGFATLVDLRSGDVVWFNELNRLSGDLRTREPAAETVKTLLEGFPQ